MTEQIPAIDIAPFLSGDTAGKFRVTDAVKRACEEIGFLVISGHGVPRETIEAMFERGFAFFNQPVEEKGRWHPTGDAKQRGYHGMATRGLSATLGKDAPKEFKLTLAFLQRLVIAGYVEAFDKVRESKTSGVSCFVKNTYRAHNESIIDKNVFKSISTNIYE